MVPCPTCGGGGVVYYEPPGWWHGSGVFTQEFTCSDCDGTGEALPEPPGPECKHGNGPECPSCPILQEV